jgi:hypothetical protein
LHEKTPPSSKKGKGNTKRKRKEHEGESGDTGGVKVTPPPPPLKSTITVEVPTREAHHKAGVLYCTVDSFEADGAGMMTTQAGEIMNVFLKNYRWKFTYKCHECDHVGSSKLPCGECEVSWSAGVLLTHTQGPCLC